MDPDANLREQLDLAAEDWTGYETSELTPEQIEKLHSDYCRLADLVQGLDQWLNRGGYLPNRWLRKGK